MSVKFRDYYQVLGIGRDASEDDLRKAYRKLARKYHPDVAEDEIEGEEKFKELNEAYEVLSDPENRKKYDALGENWKHMGDFTPPPRGAGAGRMEGFQGYGDGGSEFHFEGTGFSDFFENLFGNRTAHGGFSGVRGAGASPGGARQEFKMRGSDIEADILVTLEETMTGSERGLRLSMPGADGGSEAKSVRIRIPKGITEGQLIRCAGLGQPGYNGGESGDLFLRVRLERHPDFRIRGWDLYYDIDLAPWEAVLGTSVPIKTLHGSMRIKIPPGTESGTEMRVRGKGLPTGEGDQFGDFYSIINIVVPSEVSADEEKVWTELAEKSQFNPRP